MSLRSAGSGKPALANLRSDLDVSLSRTSNHGEDDALGQPEGGPSLRRNAGHSVLGVDEMSVALSQRLRDLRHRLAATENLQTIADIRRAATRFAERNDLPEAFATLVVCCDEKRRRIRAASATRRLALADRASTMSPRIEMRIGAWMTDEFGNLSRIVWNAEDEVPLP